MTSRSDGRSADAIREVKILTGFQKNPEGSVLYQCGGTRVLISASIEESLPPWLRGKGGGWVTAEYAMHPRANPQRKDRDGRKGKIDGRTQEIQRLIGRALRSAVALEKLGERQITIDCDVLDADGGTRTASITGGFVALALALSTLKKKGAVGAGVVRAPVAAISAGLVGGRLLLDLCYTEDSKAEVDLNVVAGEGGTIVEVQGTAEGAPVPRAHFDGLVDLSLSAVPALRAAQDAALEAAGVSLRTLLPS
jgi:ribonuclease PH